MRKILIVVGSGVKGGNTDRLTDAFCQGARDAGHHVDKVFLGEGDFHGCRGCGACQVSGKGCVIRDSMQEVYPLYEQADTVALASPLFFGTNSSQLKSFIDRLYATGKDDKYEKKDMLLLMTAGDDSDFMFQWARHYYEFICAVFGPDQGSYFAGGCEGKPGRHTIPRKHLEAVYQMGRELSDHASACP